LYRGKEGKANSSLQRSSRDKQGKKSKMRYKKQETGKQIP